MIPCGPELFPELSFSVPSEGKSPEAKEKPSFLDGVTLCGKGKKMYIKLDKN